MTVGEMFSKTKHRKCAPPESLFRVRHPEKGPMIMCVVDYAVFGKDNPEWSTWEVIDEFISQQEYDRIMEKRK